MSRWELTFVVLLGRLVDYSAVLEASEIEHANAAVGATTYKDVDAVGTKSDVEDFLVVCNQLCFCSQRRYIPYRTCSINTGCDD